ncbi:MAG: ABC transporter permease, partial [Opitutus sp.]
MAATLEQPKARATDRLEGNALEVTLGGVWRITETRPSWAHLIGGRKPSVVTMKTGGLERWDSSLLLYLFEVEEWCRATGARCNLEALPEKIRSLLTQLTESHSTSVPFDRSQNFFATVGNATMGLSRKIKDISEFVGEAVIGAVRLVKSPQK